MVCRQRSQVSTGHLPRPSSTVVCQEEQPAKAKEGNTARLLRPEPLGCYLEMPPPPQQQVARRPTAVYNLGAGSQGPS